MNDSFSESSTSSWSGSLQRSRVLFRPVLRYVSVYASAPLVLWDYQRTSPSSLLLSGLHFGCHVMSAILSSFYMIVSLYAYYYMCARICFLTQLELLPPLPPLSLSSVQRTLTSALSLVPRSESKEME